MGILHDLKLAAQLSRNSKLTVDIQQQTRALTKKDIKAWRQAWAQAIDVDNPSRLSLYAIYYDTLIDNHLNGAITQRKGFTEQKRFRVTSDSKDCTYLFQTGWFRDFIGVALDSIFWGHSLIELGNVIKTEGLSKYSYCTLVPREHVIPEYGVIVRNQGDDPKKGVGYLEGEIAKWCISVGDPKDLGILLKVSPQAIAKRHMTSYWDQFGEIFGAPIRVAKTNSRDERERKNIFEMISKMGFSNSAVLPLGTEIEIKESSRGDSFNVYDKRINRANSEISKAILGQTMTIEDGSSLSQSEVHLEVLRNIVAKDAAMISDIVNSELIPRMAQQGMIPKGCVFSWDEAIQWSPDQQLSIEKMLLENYDVDRTYFEDKYGIKLSDKKKESLGFFD